MKRSQHHQFQVLRGAKQVLLLLLLMLIALISVPTDDWLDLDSSELTELLEEDSEEDTEDQETEELNFEAIIHQRIEDHKQHAVKALDYYRQLIWIGNISKEIPTPPPRC